MDFLDKVIVAAQVHFAEKVSQNHLENICTCSHIFLGAITFCSFFYYTKLTIQENQELRSTAKWSQTACGTLEILSICLLVLGIKL